MVAQRRAAHKSWAEEEGTRWERKNSQGPSVISILIHLFKVDLLFRETGSHLCITVGLSIAPAHQHLITRRAFLQRVPES